MIAERERETWYYWLDKLHGEEEFNTKNVATEFNLEEVNGDEYNIETNVEDQKLPSLESIEKKIS